MKPSDFRRPYLVIPKLVEQPTWGGQLIVKTKGWSDRADIAGLKIGQSYELYSLSNLSVLESTDDPLFAGELSDRDSVALQTHVEHAVALADLVAASAVETLGQEILDARGPRLNLLLKYTQALGNSYQAHIKDGTQHPTYLPKPESWYYFEPGLVTLGVKTGANWDTYRTACEAIEKGILELGAQVKSGALSYAAAQPKIAALIEQYNPKQFVNTVPIAKDQLVDLSAGGLHHSWEEDAAAAPNGNVLYELQAEALDAVATFRSFDKGKMESDGTVRPLQIPEYFEFIDRDPAANDPAAHISTAAPDPAAGDASVVPLTKSRHYALEKLTLVGTGTTLSRPITRFMHLFVQSGRITVSTSEGEVTVGTAHSCFIPAAAAKYTVRSLADQSEILISY